MRAWLRGVRGRSAIAAVVVVAIGLALASATFLGLLQRELNATVQQSGTSRAADVVSQLRKSGVSGLASSLTATTRGGQIVQVDDAAGRVVAASSDRASVSALTAVRPANGKIREIQASRLSLLDDDDPYLLVVAGVQLGGQDYRVVVATPISAQQESVRTALSLLLIGIPVLLILVGLSTWLLVGRALQPVERIRARVSQIGGSRVEERIPVPAAGDEIARLATTMNEMLERLDQAQRTQRRFVADSSHELRSPLATLAASMELATADPTPQTWRELSPVMTHEVARMGRLVEDLLLLAKVDEHSMRLQVEDVDLDDLVDQEIRRLRAFPALRIVPHIEAVRIAGDRVRLGQAVTNLADNAARYALSTVRLSLSTIGAEASIVIEDDGPGVPAAQRDRVFERFVRLDASRGRSSGGSGLGLSIVREVVLAHGGTVGISDAVPSGCRVEIRLPAPESAMLDEPIDQPPSAARR
jgi:signal transduction histidine kinase